MYLLWISSSVSSVGTSRVSSWCVKVLMILIKRGFFVRCPIWYWESHHQGRSKSYSNSPGSSGGTCRNLPSGSDQQCRPCSTSIYCRGLLVLGSNQRKMSKPADFMRGLHRGSPFLDR